MLKRCGTCGIEQPASAFHRRGRIRQSVCRACRREYDAEYHRRTRERRLEQKRRYHADLVEWHRSLKDAPCSDCGGRFHHAAMTWDHREPRSKAFDVSTMIGRTHSTRQILGEIAKCDLVCANCHAVRTFRRRGVAQSGRAPGLGPGGFVGSNPTTPILLAERDSAEAEPRGSIPAFGGAHGAVGCVLGAAVRIPPRPGR